METLSLEERTKLCSSVIRRRWTAARALGCDEDAVREVVLTAVVEAEHSWDPEGGRTLFSWAWISAEWEVTKLLRHQVTVLRFPLGSLPPADPEPGILVRNALSYLQARLPDLAWQWLWMRHAEGYGLDEMAARCGLHRDTMTRKMKKIECEARRILGQVGIARGE